MMNLPFMLSCSIVELRNQEANRRTEEELAFKPLVKASLPASSSCWFSALRTLRPVGCTSALYSSTNSFTCRRYRGSDVSAVPQALKTAAHDRASLLHKPVNQVN